MARRVARRRARPAATSFDRFLDPGGLIPDDPARVNALCEALIEANGGATRGEVCPDVVSLLLSDPGDRLADYLAGGTLPEGHPYA